jgi:hypothetical protein
VEQLGLQLKEHGPDIRRVWSKVMTEPPFALPTHHQLGELSGILYEIVDVSLLRPHDLTAHESKIAAAIAHGERCRLAGEPEHVIVRELAALREAIRRYLPKCTGSLHTAREALTRLDMAISIAEIAATHGYHRDVFEAAGRWETHREEMTRLSPLLWIPAP